MLRKADVCSACGDPGDYRFGGRRYCFECHNELVKGVLPTNFGATRSSGAAPPLRRRADRDYHGDFPIETDLRDRTD